MSLHYWLHGGCPIQFMLKITEAQAGSERHMAQPKLKNCLVAHLCPLKLDNSVPYTHSFYPHFCEFTQVVFLM